MNKTKLAFLLGVTFTALVAMWLRARALTGEIELLEAAQARHHASQPFEGDEIEPVEEWGE